MGRSNDSSKRASGGDGASVRFKEDFLRETYGPPDDTNEEVDKLS